MEPELLSTSSHPGSHYPPTSSQAFPDCLFKQRLTNDDLLSKIISVNEDNKMLEHEIFNYKQQLPPILLKWWMSNNGIDKISFFLQRLGDALEAEIKDMNRTLN
jgi:hypothetical protein